MKNSYFTKTLSDLADKIIGSLDWDSKEIYPSKENVFNILDDLNRYKFKVIIIGQDLYYTPNMATGRAFDVPVGTTKLKHSTAPCFAANVCYGLPFFFDIALGGLCKTHN